MQQWHSGSEFSYSAADHTQPTTPPTPYQPPLPGSGLDEGAASHGLWHDENTGERAEILTSY